MAKVCSVEAGQLTADDKRRYDAVRGRKGVSVHSARQASVAAMLREANSDHKQIIAEVQRMYPDIINNNGEFFEDLEAQQYEDEAQRRGAAQQEMFTEENRAKRKSKKTAKVPAELSRKSIKDPEEVAADDAAAQAEKLVPDDAFSATMKLYDSLNAIDKQKLKKVLGQKELSGVLDLVEEDPKRVEEAIKDVKDAKKNRRTKRGPTGEAGGDQPGGTGKTGSGAAADADATSKGAGQPDTDPKDSEKAGQDQPPRPPQPPQTQRQKQQQVDIESLDGPGKLAHAVELITTAAGRTEESDFVKGVTILLTESVFNRPTGNPKDWLKQIDAIINEPDGVGLLWTSPERTEWTKEAFLELASEFPQKSFTITNKQGAVSERSWAAIAFDQGWLPDVLGAMGSAPTKASKRIQKLLNTLSGSEDINATVEQAVRDTKRLNIKNELASEATYNLTDTLDAILEGRPFNKSASTSRAKSLIDDGADLNFIYRGAPLKDWLPNGELQWDGDKLVTPSTAEQSTQEKLNEADTAPIEGRNSNLEDGTVITKPMSHLAVKTYISKVIKRLNPKYAPRIRHYANLEEFKKTALYQEAIASRKDGKDVIGENTAGSSFGNTVVIFRNNIKNKRHLAFVMGHEILGHFGLASVMPKAKIKKLMDTIYDTDPHVRAEAQRRMEVYGMEKTEAIEEAVADLAGAAESSTIIRMWNAIKTLLNVLRVKFSDDMARYYVNQSRRMHRTGTTGDVSANGIYSDLMDIQQRYIEGRASTNFADSRPAFRNAMDGGAGRAEALWNTLKDITSDMTSSAGLDSNVRRLSEASGSMGEMVGKFAEMFQSLDNKALRSRGLQEIFKIFEYQSEHVKKLQTTLNDTTEFSHRFSFIPDRFVTVEDKDDWKNGPAPTVKEKQQANKLLEEATLFRQPLVDDTMIGKQDAILNIGDGVITRNDENIEKLIANGTVTKEEFEAGLKTQRFNDDGTAQEGEFHTYKPDFEITGRVWKLYTEQRAAVNEAAIQVYEDKVKGMLGSKDLEIAYIQKQHKLSDEQAGILRELSDMYAKLYEKDSQLKGKAFTWSEESIKDAKVFIYQAMRVMDKKNGDLKLKDWIEGSKAEGDKGLDKFRLDKDGNLNTEMIAKLKKLNQTKINNAASVQHTLMDMHLLDTQLTNAEYAAMNSILSSYVPFVRRGDYQVRIQAYAKDADGVLMPVDLDESVKSMLYYTRTKTKAEADNERNRINEILETFNPETTEVREFSDERDKDGNYVQRNITGVVFRAESGTAASTPTLGGAINYDDMANTLLRAGIKLRDVDRERLVTMTTKQHSTARAKLRRSGNPGWDSNIMRGVAEHLEMQTHIAGKNRYKHHISHIMADKTGENNLWFGDKLELTKRQKAYIDTVRAPRNFTEAERHLAHQAMLEYQHSYVESSTEEVISIVKRDGTRKNVTGKGKGNRYKDDAGKLVEFYNANINIADATGEEKAGKYFGKFASFTAAWQLGGAIAPALINTTSLASHAIPYLSTLNQKTGYGGGHGFAKASAAIGRASLDLNLMPKIKNGKLVDEVGSAKELKEILEKFRSEGEVHHGMTKDEVQFILSLTEKGVLTPNMFNALVGTSRTGKQDNMLGRATEKWMVMFAKTEQFNRRVTALASYRLEKQRQIEAGKSKAEFATGRTQLARDVYQRAITAVNASQGNYSQYNRPNWARGNIAQYLYMYKQFVVITVQLMKNLSTKEKMMLIGFLVLMSGLKGLPFAEDIMDLVDTLMQRFPSLHWKGVEVYIAEAADAIIPGSSRWVLRGPMDYLLGATVSNRLGHGNLAPGTSFFLAGADTGREVMDVLGPIATAVDGALSAAAIGVRYASEVVGINDDVTKFRDVARTGMGSTALKALAESMIFMSDGSITNKRGQVVAKDFGPLDMITRMLGFYPSAATTQYDINRMTQRVRDYSDIIKEGYVAAHRSAGSSAERNSIERAVREWNRDAGKKSPFYIRNFSQAATRSRKEAQRTASARLLKSAPKSMRGFHKDMMDMHGFNTKGIAYDN